MATAKGVPLPAAPEPNSIVLLIGGPIAPAHVPGVCERVRVLLQAGDADLIVCDVGALVDADAVTIDALARLQLSARRLGLPIRLLHASSELQELLAFTGLGDVVTQCPATARAEAGDRKAGTESLYPRRS